MGLTIAVVGSGIMGETLSQGNAAIALPANSIATGAALYVLILGLFPISGAYFNPAVVFFDFLKGKMTFRDVVNYSMAQISGCVGGVWVTHGMFGIDIFQLSSRDRSDTRLIFSEVVATYGLLMTIVLLGKIHKDRLPAGVALYIVAAYWCTSSTSFANPAISIARSLTNTFSGVHLGSLAGFILAQVVGALLAFGTSYLLDRRA
jgi:glycerol uptake facilitator-like aquaporin